MCLDVALLHPRPDHLGRPHQRQEPLVRRHLRQEHTVQKETRAEMEGGGRVFFLAMLATEWDSSVRSFFWLKQPYLL